MNRTASALLIGIAALVAASRGPVAGQEGAAPFRAHPSTQEPDVRDARQAKQWEKELSNWGRWGTDDERGLLNLITAEKTRQATTLVREGRTVTLQINPIKKSGCDTGGFGENVHRMARIDPRTGASQLDIIQLSIHDGLQSHLDALCHYQGPIGRRPGEPAMSYNGFPFTLTAAGCQKSAADRMGPGYVTRGVLVDMPLVKKVKWLEPSRPIYPEDLEAWRARDVSLLASDAVNDVQWSGVRGINRPIHQLTQVNMGLRIVDNAYAEDAAQEAERLKRWEFMFTLHIFQVQGGTASPFNALATF